MQLEDLKKTILEGEIKPAYVFTGPELALQDIYIKKISEKANLPIKRVDSLSEIYKKITTKTIIKSTPQVYVIRDDEQYQKSGDTWKKFIECKGLRGNYVIFLYTQVDKRGKFIKEHEPIHVDFELIGSNILKNRLQAITGWPIQYCEDLVKVCGGNYGRMQNELYNIFMLAKLNEKSLLDAYVFARESNLIYEEVGDIIFDFSNAVLDRDVKKSYKLLEQLKSTEEGPVKLLSVLYNGFRNLLAIQVTPWEQRTEEILGIPKGQIYMAGKKVNNYNSVDLVAIIKLIQYIEEGIKTGKVDVEYSMDYLLGEIF